MHCEAIIDSCATSSLSAALDEKEIGQHNYPRETWPLATWLNSEVRTPPAWASLLLDSGFFFYPFVFSLTAW